MKKEKEWSSKFNPFNSNKLFAQIPRLKEIKDWEEGRGELPTPTTVSVDPANICDLSCLGCNAEFLMQRNHNLLSKDTLSEIANFLPTWRSTTYTQRVSPYRVESVCVGGGGSPLLNPHTGEFIEQLQDNGIGAGIVTNGTQIHKNLEALTNCDWVGVSVDAGHRNTYKQVKGADKFNQVIMNIRMLNEKAKSYSCNLGKEGRGHGTSYKYLLRPETVGQVYEAAKIAKGIGCRNLHIRPIAPSWDNAKGTTNVFNEQDIYNFKNQLTKARTLEDKDFGVYGVTHKFNKDFTPSHDFYKCHAIYMSAVIMPPTDKDKGKFNLNLCCDRRGDNLLTIRNLTSTQQIKDYWGSSEHRKLMDKIDVNKCPRCTFSPHNQIYENAVEINNMTPNYI